MSGGVIAQQTNINSDQYFFVLANGQQINVSTLIATNGYFSTITGDTSFISSLISQNISTTSILATTAFISSLQSADISTNNLSVSTTGNIGLSSFNTANWSEHDKTIYKFVLVIINDIMKRYKDEFREDGLDDLLLDYEKEDIINLMTSLVEKHRIYRFLSFYIPHFKGENDPQVVEEEEEENPSPLNNFIIKDTK